MPESCSASDIAESAKCFLCLNENQRDAVKLYLLAEIAGDTHTPSEQLAQARCFACLGYLEMKRVELWLMCELLNRI